MNPSLKSDLKTALVIGIATSFALSAVYLAMPKSYKEKIKDFIKKKFAKKEIN